MRTDSHRNRTISAAHLRCNLALLQFGILPSLSTGVSCFTKFRTQNACTFETVPVTYVAICCTVMPKIPKQQNDRYVQSRCCCTPNSFAPFLKCCQLAGLGAVKSESRVYAECDEQQASNQQHCALLDVGG